MAQQSRQLLAADMWPIAMFEIPKKRIDRFNDQARQQLVVLHSRRSRQCATNFQNLRRADFGLRDHFFISIKDDAGGRSDLLRAELRKRNLACFASSAVRAMSASPTGDSTDVHSGTAFWTGSGSGHGSRNRAWRLGPG